MLTPGNAPAQGMAGQSGSNAMPGGFPMYQPPARGAPGGRIGGSTRGTEDDVPYLSVLAPDHTGLSSSDQPVLYWYISEPVDSFRLDLSLLNDMDDDPTLEVTYEDGIAKGIHALNLAEHGVRLSPGVEYEWSVSLMVDPDNRSKDVFTRGLVMFVEDGAAMKAAVSDAQESDMHFALASQGLWYDALTAVSNLVDDNPQDGTYHNHRAALLEQIDLAEVAAYDRGAAAN